MRLVLGQLVDRENEVGFDVSEEDAGGFEAEVDR